MAFRLKEVVFRVRCREEGCPFTSDFAVKENIMGGTQEDVDSEALKIARDQAMTKHDAIYGRRHTMLHPEVHKVAGSYEQIGGLSSPAAPSGRDRTAHTQSFSRGEKIVAKGERATTVCEVVRGSAVNEARPGIVYRPGATFGAAALFEHKRRMASIVAAEDGTQVAFYDMRDLAKSDPAKAHELYNEAMEDIFNVLAWLEGYAASLEKKIEKLRAEKKPVKAVARAKTAAKKPVARKASKKAAPKKPAGKKAPSRKAPPKKAAKKRAASKKPARKKSRRR
jgi:CRP-like cAMP-binding protein